MKNLGSSETSALALLLSPTLRILNMQFSTSYEPDEEYKIAERVVLSLFQTLRLMAPDLESLEYALDIDLDHEHMESFGHLTRLKTLSVGTGTPVNEHALRMLSNISALRELSCHIDLSHSPAFPRPRYTFQQLTSLFIHGQFDSLNAFMQASQLPGLANIALRIWQLPGAGELVDAFAAVCKRCDPALLTSFSVDFAWSIATPHPIPSCVLQYLEPLLALPNIVSFHLKFSHKFMPSIHDDDLSRFGGAWSRLSSFRVSVISRRFSQPRVARPTLFGLIDLARRCPGLNVFQIPELDMNVPLLEKDAALPLGHGLQIFLIRHVMLPSPESPAFLEAATLLGRLFPSIDVEDAQSTMMEPSAEKWKKFLGLLDAVRLAREERRS